MPCNCNLCDKPSYPNVSIEVLLALRDSYQSIIESLEKKDISDTLDHYKNRLRIIQDCISYRIDITKE
jgi:hypothetical protein